MKIRKSEDRDVIVSSYDFNEKDDNKYTVFLYEDAIGLKLIKQIIFDNRENAIEYKLNYQGEYAIITPIKYGKANYDYPYERK